MSKDEKRWRPGSIIIDGDLVVEGFTADQVERMATHWRHHSVAINGSLIIRAPIEKDREDA